MKRYNKYKHKLLKMFLRSVLDWPTLLVEFSRNPDATVEITGLAPPKAHSHNPSSNPRGQDRCSVSFLPRSWAPGDAVLSRCEHREGQTDGRIYPLRKVRTLGAVGRYSSDWSKLLQIISSQTGHFDSWEISVVYNGLSGIRGWDGCSPPQCRIVNDLSTKK